MVVTERVAGVFAGIADAARAITSALTGERESMKRLGIVIKQVDVDMLALQMSGKLFVTELTNADRVAATMAIAIERAGSAIGDLSRTNTDAAGSIKTMVSEIRDFQTKIGQAFVPAIEFEEAIGAIIDRTPVLAVSGEAVKEAFRRDSNVIAFARAADLATTRRVPDLTMPSVNIAGKHPGLSKRSPGAGTARTSIRVMG